MRRRLAAGPVTSLCVAAVIQTLVSKVIGKPMVCVFRSFAVSADPNIVDPGVEFWLESGLDMEVYRSPVWQRAT
jgi:hypothetical protein